MNNGVVRHATVQGDLSARGLGGRVDLVGPRGFPPGKPLWDSTAWQSAFSRARSGLGQAHIVCYGDSVTQGGTGTTTYRQTWPEVLRDYLEARTAVPAGTGIFPYYETSFTLLTPISTTGTWGLRSGGGESLFNQWYQGTTAGGTITFGGVICDAFRIWYFGTGSGANFTYAVDGGSASAPVSTGGGQFVRYLDVPAGVEGVHSITLTVDGGLTNLMGCEALRNTSRGVKVSRIAYFGKQTSELVNDSTNCASLDFVRIFDADLSIVMMGLNECNTGTSLTTFAANLKILTDVLVAQGSSVMMAVAPPFDPAGFGGGRSWDSYAAVIRQHAANYNFGLLDVTAEWGTYANKPGFYVDAVHPTIAGLAEIARLATAAVLAPVL